MSKTVRPLEGSRRGFSDWFGCVFFAASALFLLLRTPAVGLLMLPGILLDLLTAACFLLRGTAKAKLAGLGPRLAAYGASVLIPGLMIAQTTRHPDWPPFSSSTVLLIFGLVFWAAGTPLMLFGVWNLRRSFSIEPQARQLITRGSYRFARHPIYAGYHCCPN